MIAIKTRLSVRAAMITLLAIIVADVTACDDEPHSSDMAVCDRTTPPASTTPCGANTCPAGQICFIYRPGYCPPPDLAVPPDGGAGGAGAGGPNTCVEYRCSEPPAACDCYKACGSFIGASPIVCRYDGATLSCGYN